MNKNQKLNILKAEVKKWHAQYLVDAEKRWDDSAGMYYQGYEDGHMQATGEAVGSLLQLLHRLCYNRVKGLK